MDPLQASGSGSAKVRSQAPARRDPAQLADALAGLLKACSVYPRNHPRVQDGAADLVQKLQAWIESPQWLSVRARGAELVLGGVVLAKAGPLVPWLLGRFPEMALAGLEFGPAVDVEAVVELGHVFARSGGRFGRPFAALWPRGHAKVRPLDLVFQGGHEAAGPAGSGIAAQDVWKVDLLARLCELPEVRALLASIEQCCAQAGPLDAATVRVDLLAGIVELLPTELAREPLRAVAVVQRALQEIEVGVARVMHDDSPIGDAEILRTALAVAKKYFENIGDPIEVGSAELPAGRPEDEAITADLDLLLDEYERLPATSALRLPAADACTAGAPELAVELLGVYLHVLVTTERPESLRALGDCLPKVLRDVDAARLSVLDCFLKPQGRGGATLLDDRVRLELLGFLERARRTELITTRGYVDAGFVERTFPGSLPLCARLLRHTEPGLQLLADALRAIGAPRLLAGADLLKAQGTLTDPALLAAITAIGGELVLPLVQKLASVDSAAAKPTVVAYLRQLPLPAAEAAALHHVEPATSLPAPYLQDLARMAADHSRDDARARQSAAHLLCQFVRAGARGLSLLQRLAAIAALEHLPGPETALVLQQLARGGRFLHHGRGSRAVRRLARETLRRLRAVEARP